MGWKNVKEHYRIGHAVQVTPEGICIGSPYVHNLIVIGLDGTIKKRDDGRSNDDLKRYMAEFDASPVNLKNLVLGQDKFSKSITVYTYDRANIIETQCEKLGWPNVTHDGQMMYENTFSPDKAKVIQWAKSNAAYGVPWRQERIREKIRELATLDSELSEVEGWIAKLEADYPAPAGDTGAGMV